MARANQVIAAHRNVFSDGICATTRFKYACKCGCELLIGSSAAALEQTRFHLKCTVETIKQKTLKMKPLPVGVFPEISSPPNLASVSQTCVHVKHARWSVNFMTICRFRSGVKRSYIPTPSSGIPGTQDETLPLQTLR